MITPVSMNRKRPATTLRQLAKTMEGLTPEQQRTVLRFAEFLRTESLQEASPATPAALPEPKLVPRPAQESVIRAMRRLSESYFMLDRGPLLNETSTLMAQHVLQGRSSEAVIADLEVLFHNHYLQMRNPS